MAVFLGLLLILILLIYAKKDSVQADYVFFCIVFMLLFYILPATLISFQNTVYYAYRIWHFSVEDLELITGGFFIFLVGFFMMEYPISMWEAKSIRRKRHFGASKRAGKRNMHPSVLTGMLLLLSAILVYIIAIDYSSTVYLIRSGQIEGNYFVTLLMAACLVVTVFCMASLEDSNSIVVKLIPILLVIGFALQVGGRTTLIFSVAYAGIMFGLRLKRAVMVSMLFFPILLPLIRDGKTLIYYISTGLPLNEYQLSLSFDLAEFTTLYFDAIMTNFAHPVISLATAPLLVEKIGFRYFYDYIHGLLFYARVIGFDAGDSLTYMNTELILGARRSTVPTGYLAFGYVQLSLIGIFVSGCFYRLLGFFAIKFLGLMKESSNVLRFHVTLLCAYSFYTGEIRTMVLTVFFPIVVIKILQRVGKV